MTTIKVIRAGLSSQGKFEALLTAEVPDELVLLNRQQSAMRRNVNTTMAREHCEQTLAEFTQASDPLLDLALNQLLTSTKSIIDRRAARSPQ